jgi:hypothetical protein
VSTDDSIPERWIAIPGYVGLYEVSDLGRVRSVSRRIATRRGGTAHFEGKLLRAHPDTRGYIRVALCSGGARRTVQVHRLVLTAFIGERPLGMESRHLNGDRTDARLANLSYGTRDENMADRKAHQRGLPLDQCDLSVCAHGHSLAEVGVYVRAKSRAGKRECRECRRQQRNNQTAELVSA